MTAADAVSGQGQVFAVQPNGELDHRVGHVVRLDQESPSKQVRLVFVLPRGSDETADHGESDQWPRENLRKIIAEIATEHPRIHDLSGLVGTHPLTGRLRKQVEAAGFAVQADVMIIGDEGCGIERIARTIFQLREFESSTLPALINARLVDQQELQQAINQAQRLTPDRLRPTTLLIQNVDHLSEACQMELLGFLVLPGSRLRVLCTTTSSPLTLAAESKFDFELAVRLCPLVIEVPSLHSRKTDIPAIATHLLEQIQLENGVDQKLFSKPAIDLLSEYNWPGDIEQLRHVLQRAVTNAPTSLIEPEHFPEVVRYGIQAQRLGRPTTVEIDLDAYLASIERQLIERALFQSKLNKTQTAKLLGINRARLLRRCEQLQLIVPDDPVEFHPAETDDMGNGTTKDVKK
jgi:DNA-binding NtrC family response regulator